MLANTVIFYCTIFAVFHSCFSNKRRVVSRQRGGCRLPRNNCCLVGPPGVGKTAVVEGLAQRIAEGKVEGCGSVVASPAVWTWFYWRQFLVSNQRFRPKKWFKFSGLRLNTKLAGHGEFFMSGEGFWVGPELATHQPLGVSSNVGTRCLHVYVASSSTP